MKSHGFSTLYDVAMQQQAATQLSRVQCCSVAAMTYEKPQKPFDF